MKMQILVMLLLLMPSSFASSEEKVINIIGYSADLELGNYIQHVWIRAKSVDQEETCTNSYYLGVGNEVEVAAPPGVFSAWRPFPKLFTGPARVKFLRLGPCESGVIVEVKYQK